MTDKIILEPTEHRYTLNDKPIIGVNEAIDMAGLGIMSSANFINEGVLEASMKFGTATHRACELYDRHDLAIDLLDESLRPYLNGWIKFLKDSKFEIHKVELIVYSKRHGYAGTLDRTGIFMRSRTIIDLKSGAKDKITPIKTAAYMEAHNEMFPKEKIRHRMTLILKPDNYDILPNEDPSDFSTFLACLQIAKFKNKYKIK